MSARIARPRRQRDRFARLQRNITSLPRIIEAHDGVPTSTRYREQTDIGPARRGGDTRRPYGPAVTRTRRVDEREDGRTGTLLVVAGPKGSRLVMTPAQYRRAYRCTRAEVNQLIAFSQIYATLSPETRALYDA